MEFFKEQNKILIALLYELARELKPSHPILAKYIYEQLRVMKEAAAEREPKIPIKTPR